MPNRGSGPPTPKDDSLRSCTTLSDSLTDQLFAMRHLPLPLYHPRGLPVRSLLPRRTQEEQREFISSFLREALSIIDNDFDLDDEDDDSADADDDDGKGRGASSSSSDYGDSKQ